LSDSVLTTAATDVDSAIDTRMSARAFLPQTVPKDVLMSILEVAARAPSGTNTQPWKVYVLQGESRDSLVAKVCSAADAVRADPTLAAQYKEAYDYYPEKWVSPFIDRRRENGWGLYGLLGIGKADRDRMHAQHLRNFMFLTPPWAWSSRSTRSWAVALCWTTACSSKTSCWRRVRVAAHLSAGSMERVCQHRAAPHWRGRQ
jgi:nitroreductase